jgi:MFS superfamily sulfate permease-like transporter
LEIAPRFVTLSLFLPRLPRLPLVVVVVVAAVGVSVDPAGIIAGIVLARLSFLVRAAAVIAIGREEEEGEQEEGEALVPVAAESAKLQLSLSKFVHFQNVNV